MKFEVWEDAPLDVYYYPKTLTTSHTHNMGSLIG